MNLSQTLQKKRLVELTAAIQAMYRQRRYRHPYHYVFEMTSPGLQAQECLEISVALAMLNSKRLIL
jgi:hypothetical protein